MIFCIIYAIVNKGLVFTLFTHSLLFTNGLSGLREHLCFSIELNFSENCCSPRPHLLNTTEVQTTSATSKTGHIHAAYYWASEYQTYFFCILTRLRIPHLHLLLTTRLKILRSSCRLPPRFRIPDTILLHTCGFQNTTIILLDFFQGTEYRTHHCCSLAGLILSDLILLHTIEA